MSYARSYSVIFSPSAPSVVEDKHEAAFQNACQELQYELRLLCSTQEIQHCYQNFSREEKEIIAELNRLYQSPIHSDFQPYLKKIKSSSLSPQNTSRPARHSVPP